MSSVVTLSAIAAGLAALALLIAVALGWQLIQLRRRLAAVAQALNAAGDGLEALDEALQADRREILKANNGVKRCWRAVHEQSPARRHDDSDSTAAQPGSVQGETLARSEAELLEFSHAPG